MIARVAKVSCLLLSVLQTSTAQIFSSTTPVLTLTPANTLSEGDLYGHAVALYGGSCAVSSYHRTIDDGSEFDDADDRAEMTTIGVVHLFTYGNGAFVDRGVIYTSPNKDDGYGDSIAIWMKTMVVGAWRDSSNGEYSGKAYIHTTASNWFDTRTVISSDAPVANEYFGYSVAIVGGDTTHFTNGTVVVGAYGHARDPGMRETGCVYVYAYLSAAWTLLSKIYPSELVGGEKFGFSLSTDDFMLAVGAPGAASAYLFHLEAIVTECPHDVPMDQLPDDCEGPGMHTYSSWQYYEVVHMYVKTEPREDNENFGVSVAVANLTGVTTVVVGDSTNNDDEVYGGAVYIFSDIRTGDIEDGWAPEEEEHPPGGRRLQGVRNDEHAQNKWSVDENQFHTDKDGSYWMLEKKITLGVENGHLGRSVAIYNERIVTGLFNDEIAGITLVYSRQGGDSDAPVNDGSLYNREWKIMSRLYSPASVVGDRYGSTVAIHSGRIVVGSVFSGEIDEVHVGTGAAYLYDPNYVPPSTDDAPNIDKTDDTDDYFGTDGQQSSGDGVSDFTASHVALVLLVVFFAVIGFTSMGMSAASTVFSYFAGDDEGYGKKAPVDLDSSIDSVSATSSHPLTSFDKKKKKKDRREHIASSVV